MRGIFLVLGLMVGCPEAPAPVAPEAPKEVRPDPELPDRRALFQAAWGVTDYARPVTEIYASLERGYLFVGQAGLTEAGAIVVGELAGLHTHGLDPRAIGRDALVADARGWRGGVAEERAALELRLAVGAAFWLDHMGGLLTLQEEAALTWAKSRWRERTVRFVEHLRRGAPSLPELGPGYPALQAALARYQGIAGFPSTPRVNRRRRRWLERGRRGPQVAVLARRLIAEGFMPPPVEGQAPGETFDEAVEEGVRTFQQAHGIEPDGVVGPTVLRSMEVTPADKVLQLRVALRRAREGRIRVARHGGGDGEEALQRYVRVNVPAFRLTAVDGGRTLLDMPLVVGSPKEEVDEESGERIRPNATPLMQATITHLVWNPLWHVPERIKNEELDPHLMDDPNWYALNGYRLEVDGAAGTERAVQMPGPDNALGQLKVLFPNRHDVYLHDTPKRGLFGRARRAASHGCMRMEDPVALAKILLLGGDQWDEAEATRLLTQPAESEEFPLGVYERRWVKLKRPAPVFIDYQTVTARPDLPGGVVFHDDLYALDAPYAERLKSEDARLDAEAARLDGHPAAR